MLTYGLFYKTKPILANRKPSQAGAQVTNLMRYFTVMVIFSEAGAGL